MTWTRKVLWEQHDRRHARRLRTGSFLLAASFVVMWFAVAMMSYACHELVFEEGLRSPTNMVRAGDECISDSDCAVLPAQVTCCGECAAVPPFEATTRDALAEYRDAIATSCAPATRLCDPPTCASVPAGCVPRAVCDDGTCRVSATDACTYR